MLVAAAGLALVACAGSSDPDTATPSDPSTTGRPAAPAAPTTDGRLADDGRAGDDRSTDDDRGADHDGGPDDDDDGAAPAPGYPGQPSGVPFPTTEWAVGDLPTGVDKAAIDAAVDRAFGAPDAEGRVQSIVIVEGGKIVYEHYHPLDGPDKIYDSWSVAKSFTSALIGLLVADGNLSLDEHPARPEWQTPGDPRQAITLRQLLQMSSGLEWGGATTRRRPPVRRHRRRRRDGRPTARAGAGLGVRVLDGHDRAAGRASPPTSSAAASRRSTTSTSACSTRSA